MLSFDTNLAVHAANAASPVHEKAYEFIASLGARRDVAICELMLVEVYLKLRNARIFPNPLSGVAASAACQTYRNNASWMLIDTAPIMDEVWKWSAGRSFAFRRIVDIRLARTLMHHGVDEFATSNVKDFEGVGFKRVWDPLAN